jgi:hypothetical protein
MNNHHDGGGDGLGILIIILAAAVGLLVLSPFALPIWLMFLMSEIMNAIGVHPMVGVVAVAGVCAGIAVLLFLFRPLRYVYVVLNALLIGGLVYNHIFDPHAHNHNFATVIAAVLFLAALIGGIGGEIFLHERISEIVNEDTPGAHQQERRS